MNYLAHIFLSGHEEDIIIGNFIGDFVKGRHYGHYPEGIAKGILLHRNIDTYTDEHLLVRQSNRRLHAAFGKYAGVLTDIFYDHFLALHWERYASEDLPLFAEQVYTLFAQKSELMPERVQTMVPYMIKQNWLVNYADLSAIDKTLQRLLERVKYNPGIEKAGAFLQQEYAGFEADFLEFFPDVVTFARRFLER